MENNDVPIESKEKNLQPEQVKLENINQETVLEKAQENLNSDEGELKDHYSLDDISFSKLEKSFYEEEEEEDEEGKALRLKKKKKVIELSQLILDDKVEEFKKIIENDKSLIKKKTLEGFSLIQYAALNGALNCFLYLVSLKVSTNEDIEGFYLIHLPLLKAIKVKYNEKCLQMFTYIYLNFPEQRKYRDRLGRNCFHIIFEYNLYKALTDIKFSKNNIDINDLFVEDNMGQYAINYLIIYDAYESFCSVNETEENLANIYYIIRNKSIESKISSFRGEEKFLENLLLYKNFRILSVIIKVGFIFQNILYEDLQKIYRKYFTLLNENSDNKENQDNSSINEILYYVDNFLKCFPLSKDHTTPLNLNYNKTAIIYNKDCINHIKLLDNDKIKHYDQRSKLIENSDRLGCLIDEEEGIILNNDIFISYEISGNIVNNKYTLIQTQKKSCLNDILKCHDIKYIKALKYKSDNIKFNKSKKKESNSQYPKFWDNMNLELIEKNYFLYNDKTPTDNTDNNTDNNMDEDEDEEEEISKEKIDELYLYQKIDIDTFINKYSYENIFNTTGCVFEAIDSVMSEMSTNAFALIRPPGHHAGYYGPVENSFETSNGFCLVNNVAIGAAYTKYKYHDKINKIAIVDIDVHHGNGTEEIVEMLNFKNFSKPFTYEKICGVKIEDKRSINWYDFDDAKNILFISTHIYDKNKPDKFYPYSGSEETNTPKDNEIYPGGIFNIPFEYKKNYPYDYKNILRTKIIPRLYKFKPDIIFVSAGFDGHKMELINESKMLLEENDYGYISEQLQIVANKFCNGRLIAVLEGGYNVNTGLISPFAQSVFKFIRHMNIGANKYYCGEGKLTNHKREYIYNEEMLAYKNNVKDEEEEIEENKPRRSTRLRHILEKEKKEKEMKNMVNNNETQEMKEDKKDEVKDNDIKEEKEEMEIKDNNKIIKESIINDKNDGKEENIHSEKKEEKEEKIQNEKKEEKEEKDKNEEDKDKKNEENTNLDNKEGNKEELNVQELEENKNSENKDEINKVEIKDNNDKEKDNQKTEIVIEQMPGDNKNEEKDSTKK